MKGSGVGHLWSPAERTWCEALSQRKYLLWNAQNCLTLRIKQNKMEDILDLIKMIGFLVEDQIILLKHF